MEAIEERRRRLEDVAVSGSERGDGDIGRQDTDRRGERQLLRLMAAAQGRRLGLLMAGIAGVAPRWGATAGATTTAAVFRVVLCLHELQQGLALGKNEDADERELKVEPQALHSRE